MPAKKLRLRFRADTNTEIEIVDFRTKNSQQKCENTKQSQKFSGDYRVASRLRYDYSNLGLRRYSDRSEAYCQNYGAIEIFGLQTQIEIASRLRL